MSQWKSLKLPDCLERTGKISKIKKKQFLDHGEYPVVSQEQGLINGHWNDVGDVVKVDEPLVIFGDHTQILKLIDFDFVVGADGVKLLKPKPFLYAKYLYYFLLGNPIKALGYARHFRLLKELDIYYPPLPEQKCIVAILDEAFAGIETAIANTEKNLANACELFESYLNSTFRQRDEGWSQKQLGALTEVQSGGTPLKSKLEYWDGGIPWYSSGELNKLATKIPVRTISEIGLDNSNAKLFPVGSLLIGMYDTAALKMSILDREAAFNQAIAAAKPTDGLDMQFVLFSIQAIKPAILNLRRGVRQKNLSLQKIKNISIHIPEFPEQKAVTQRVLAVKLETENLETIYQQKLTALAELKQSLLQKAFSGELTIDKEAINQTLGEGELVGEATCKEFLQVQQE